MKTRAIRQRFDAVTRLRAIAALLWALALWVLSSGVASAHDAPAGSEWTLADFMLYVFLIFAGAGLAVLLWAIKKGYLYHLEDAKYPMLTEIYEEDFWTPDWVEEEGQEVLT